MRLSSRHRYLTLFGSAALVSCSMIYDLSPDQCSTREDCASFGEGYTCAAGMCVGPADETGGKGGKGGTSGTSGGGTGGGGTGGAGATNGGGGTSGEGGEATGGTGGSSGSGGKGECVTAADCLAESPIPRACIEGTPGEPSTRTCVELTTPDCPLILPSGGEAAGGEMWLYNLQAPDPIIVGAFGHVPAALFSVITRNYDLALTEFTLENEGIPGPNGTTRPLVMVVCDNQFSGDPAEVRTSTRHLVDDLRVPGIVAGLLAADLQTSFSEMRNSDVNSDVYYISPLDSDPAIATIQDQNLIWTLLPGADAVAAAYGPLLLRTIDYLKAGTSPRVPVGETIKVAVVTAPDIRFLGDLSDALRDVLQWNGMSFDENVTANNVLELTVPSSDQDPDAPLTTQIGSILDFAPHVVIELGYNELFTTLLPAIEANWETENPGQARPFYLLSPYHYNAPSIDEAINMHRTPDALHLRTAGVNWASTPDELRPILDDYLRRYGLMFTDDPNRPGWENYYDAPWWLIYAISAGALRLERFNGLDLVDGMDRLVSGTEYAVGPDDIQDILSTLALTNGRLTLNGTLGAPSFDLTGNRSDTGSVWCVDSAAAQHIDVLRVDPAADPMAWASDDLVGDGFMQCNAAF